MSDESLRAKPGRSDPGDWRRLVVEPATPVRRIMEVLEREQRQIVLVAGEDGVLLGTITDGDIRRAFLRGTDLQRTAADIMNTAPRTVSSAMNARECMRLLRLHGVSSLPVIDETRRIVGVFTGLRAAPRRDNPVILMAGGEGRRLRPLTEHCPKPLLPIGGRPILETIIENLRLSGLWNIKISINYRGDMIRNHFGDGRAMGVSIDYLVEDTPLGTAGALGLLRDSPSLPVIVMNGDVLTKLDCASLLDFHAEQGAPVTACVAEYLYTLPYGIMDIDGSRLMSVREKPTQRAFVNAGIYVVAPEICGRCTGRIDMTDILSALCEEERPPAVFPIHEYWADIGQLADFERAATQFDLIWKLKNDS